MTSARRAVEACRSLVDSSRWGFEETKYPSNVVSVDCRICSHFIDPSSIAYSKAEAQALVSVE